MSFFGFRSQSTTKAAPGTDESLYDEYMAADSNKLPTNLSGIVVAITGTTTGLGYHLARLAITKNAKCVLLLNRPSDRSEKAKDELNEKYNKNGKTIVQTVACDLMDVKSVQGAAEEINQIASRHGGLDVLCCNAGIMMMDDKRTKDGYEIQMQTNQLSHAMLIYKVWKSLQMAATSRGEARIVLQSSSMRNTPASNLQSKFFVPSEPGTLGGDSAWFFTQMFGWSEGPISRYHQSKLANSAFVMAFHQKLLLSNKDGGTTSSKIKVMACDPGFSVTPLQTTSQHMPTFLNWIPMPKQSPADGCLNAAMCCFSLEAESGDLYAPENGMVGRPIKVISKGQPVHAKTEGLTCSTENQQIVWEGCERALGVTFDV